jgi:hypothetical protein
MRPRLLRRILGFFSVMVLSVALGGAASAIWGGSGHGTGSASTGTVVSLTLSPGTPLAGLYPGGRADVVLTIHNPNSAQVRVSSLSLDSARAGGGYAADAEHAGCAVTTFGFATQTNGGAGWTVPSHDSAAAGVLSVTLADALSMDVGAANACQGVTVTVYLTAGP